MSRAVTTWWASMLSSVEVTALIQSGPCLRPAAALTSAVMVAVVSVAVAPMSIICLAAGPMVSVKLWPVESASSLRSLNACVVSAEAPFTASKPALRLLSALAASRQADPKSAIFSAILNVPTAVAMSVNACSMFSMPVAAALDWSWIFWTISLSAPKNSVLSRVARAFNSPATTAIFHSLRPECFGISVVTGNHAVIFARCVFRGRPLAFFGVTHARFGHGREQERGAAAAAGRWGTRVRGRRFVRSQFQARFAPEGEVERIEGRAVFGTVRHEGTPGRERGAIFMEVPRLDVPHQQSVEFLDREIPEF